MIVVLRNKDGSTEVVSGVTYIVEPPHNSARISHPNNVDLYRGKGSLENAELLAAIQTNNTSVEILPEG